MHTDLAQPRQSLPFYISVDVETAGPSPSNYSLLSIGACSVDDPSVSFYIELKPIHSNISPKAIKVHGLDLDTLATTGIPPRTAMKRFRDWIVNITPPDHKPVFIGFNAPFDWMFVNDYFHRYLGSNPFGHAAIDIRSYYMGLRKVTSGQASMKQIAQQYGNHDPLTHNAMDDAIYQARLFTAMLQESLSSQPI
ncbi:MAG TPA: 3'-5' exonuclease [Anaerolineaceae bacterium]|nr:3'-5' exonuclease [Anaerolineaceae bacterium]HOU43862.1 3'-5' exonuclease [Anaerolineaceae bacterium]HQF44197.1 3'-5' exonuclease [Anaerolineaceae bacterium]HQH34244.1 3'-5' exonuclease [Anaerolineaceae bacterium]HQJ03485.1 3'-5' exonuclease [Anaerolineaceae bacterium]